MINAETKRKSRPLCKIGAGPGLGITLLILSCTLLNPARIILNETIQESVKYRYGVIGRYLDRTVTGVNIIKFCTCHIYIF